jgi:hypothetical protein
MLATTNLHEPKPSFHTTTNHPRTITPHHHQSSPAQPLTRTPLHMHRPGNTNPTPNLPQSIEPQAPAWTTIHGTSQGLQCSPSLWLSPLLHLSQAQLLYVDETDIITPTTNPPQPIEPQVQARTNFHNTNQGIGRSPPLWLARLLHDKETDINSHHAEGTKI